ncbi:hypothetical protein PST86_14760 [Yersinia pestis]|nr:hypothetical protein [Yersinia pestis]
MKRLFLSLVSASVFLLSACGGDDGELAGKWKGDKEGKYWVLKYNKGDDDYTQSFISKDDNGNEFVGTTNVHLKRKDNWISGQKEKYFIKVINKDTLQFRDDEKDVYRRLE